MSKVSYAAALSWAAVAFAAGPPEEVRWSGLAARTEGREIAIPLAGGVKVTGRMLAVKDDSLLFAIRESSDWRRYARGEAVLPRAAVTEVRVLERRGKGRRYAGALLGIVVGFVGGMNIAESVMHSSSDAAACTMFLSVWGATSVGGYYAGKRMEQQWKRLRIAP